jgi:protein-S-isoprenylcysteine O-methyltransferase Ste14
MPSPSRKAIESPGPDVAGRGLRRVPLSVRMVFYGVFFLSTVLIALPWLASRIDVLAPAWQVEVGWFRLAGAVLFVVCFVIYVRSSYLLTRHGRGAYVEFDPPQEFVAIGPYRWVRNPIAASLVLMLLGESMALSSTGVFLLFLLSVPLAHLQVVRLEEPLLRKRFGQSYADYVACVPRWIPRRPRALPLPLQRQRVPARGDSS